MAEHYRRQVATLADALTAEANRAEATDILRGLIDRIELTPNEESRKLEIDIYGDLAGILGLAANKNGPLDESDPSVQQVKLVAGAGCHLYLRGSQVKIVAGMPLHQSLHSTPIEQAAETLRASEGSGNLFRAAA